MNRVSRASGAGGGSEQSGVPPAWRTLGPERYELGEGGRWDGAAFWQVDLLAGRLFRGAAPWKGLDLVLEAGRPVGCLVPTDGGFLVLAGRGVGAVDRLGTPEVSLQMLCEPAPRGHRINDGAVCGGRLYFGTMDPAGTVGHGALWRMDSDGAVTKVLDGLGCPNGPVFSPDGTALYLADSTRSVIYRYDLRHDGTLGAAEVFADFPIGSGVPDGMLVDGDGRLWVAIWDGAAVRRFNPDGTLDAEMPLPVRCPTSVTAVPGAVLVTSARLDLSHPTGFDGATLVLSQPVRPPAVQRFAMETG